MAIADLRAEITANADGALVISLEGELDLASEYTLTSWIAAFQDEASYVIDLRGVSFIDSCGVRALVKAQALADCRNATLVLRSPTQQARRLFVDSGLDEQFTID
jgi:anti-anti-sigma factor